ncbi:hypothetical protein ES703_62467 [subsurface metagenome]
MEKVRRGVAVEVATPAAAQKADRAEDRAAVRVKDQAERAKQRRSLWNEGEP